MSYIIDRRPNVKKKSTVNRRRFLQRYRDHVKRAVDDAVSRRSITDLESGESVTIPSRDIHEPVFSQGPGGVRSRVLPGNHEFVAGDRIPRPPGGSGGGAGEGEASDSGDGEDEFVFQITQSEFLHYLFDNLELPNLAKKQLTGSDVTTWQRAGFSSVGVPAKLDIRRSMCQSRGRRLAIGGAYRARIRRMEERLEAVSDPEERHLLDEELQLLRKRSRALPFLEDMDLRFRLDMPKPVPTSKAVMFCLMDVSGSMDQKTKDKAKRFFLLLHLFLRKHYERTDVVFIRHHTSAKEVDEQEFFYARETGGTIVSSALDLTSDIIASRYPVSDWNIYAAQASDGDNWPEDTPRCLTLLESLLPLLQYFVYVEITQRSPQSLWHGYAQLAAQHQGQMAQQRIADVSDIFPVFRELFERKVNE